MTTPSSKNHGVVVLPMVFGPSSSFKDHLNQLRDQGFAVEAIDYYQSQDFKVPFWPKMVGNPNPIVKKLDVEKVNAQIRDAIEKLKSKGCEDITLMGFGLGADLALWYSENTTNPIADKIIGWYPHMDSSEMADAEKTPPDMSKIGASVLLFYGIADTIVPKAHIAALEASTKKENKKIRIDLYRDVDHAFADRSIQGSWPNALFYKAPIKNAAAEHDSWGSAIQFINGD